MKTGKIISGSDYESEIYKKQLEKFKNRLYDEIVIIYKIGYIEKSKDIQIFGDNL